MVQSVRRAADTTSTSTQDMRVDHDRASFYAAQRFFHALPHSYGGHFDRPKFVDVLRVGSWAIQRIFEFRAVVSSKVDFCNCDITVMSPQLKQIPRRPIVIYRDVQIRTGGQQARMPRRCADFGQCTFARQSMTDEGVPAVMQRQRPQPVPAENTAVSQESPPQDVPIQRFTERGGFWRTQEGIARTRPVGRPHFDAIREFLLKRPTPTI